ncbi:MAG TPA: DinB family protein [Chryseolinea sp.]|nr:DinB family protein [Chryseolinea sp.]
MISTDSILPDSGLFVRTTLKAWETQVNRMNDFFESVSDDDLMTEIAPGRNTGVYLLGHLTAVNDGILPLLGLGQKLYPQLEKIFITSPDKSGLEFPAIKELRQYWSDVNEELMEHFVRMEPAEWLAKHVAVSAEDFAKEPHRNRLNVVISRTTHMHYHLGQLILLR